MVMENTENFSWYGLNSCSRFVWRDRARRRSLGTSVTTPTISILAARILKKLKRQVNTPRSSARSADPSNTEN